MLSKYPPIKIGDLLGNWRVLSRGTSDISHRKRWLCECICGNKKERDDHSLRNGKSKSCGERKCNNGFKDLTGITFGMWTVIGLSETIKRKGCLRWNLICKCGTISTASTNCLMMKGTKSCGCSSVEMMVENSILPPGEAAFRKIFSSYVFAAKSRNFSFEFQELEFRKLLGQNCYYCGCKPFATKESNGKSIKWNGVDRVDNSRGYDRKNCVSCCTPCNKKKMAVTIEIAIKMVEFLELNKNSATV
jgi:hypothetical protein